MTMYKETKMETVEMLYSGDKTCVMEKTNIPFHGGGLLCDVMILMMTCGLENLCLSTTVIHGAVMDIYRTS